MTIYPQPDDYDPRREDRAWDIVGVLILLLAAILAALRWRWR